MITIPGVDLRPAPATTRGTAGGLDDPAAHPGRHSQCSAIHFLGSFFACSRVPITSRAMALSFALWLRKRRPSFRHPSMTISMKWRKFSTYSFHSSLERIDVISVASHAL